MEGDGWGVEEGAVPPFQKKIFSSPKRLLSVRGRISDTRSSAVNELQRAVLSTSGDAVALC